jgi:hypothetical protein
MISRVVSIMSIRMKLSSVRAVRVTRYRYLGANTLEHTTTYMSYVDNKKYM